MTGAVWTLVTIGLVTVMAAGMKLHAPLRVTWYLLILRFAKKREAFIHGLKICHGSLLHMIEPLT